MCKYNFLLFYLMPCRYVRPRASRAFSSIGPYTWYAWTRAVAAGSRRRAQFPRAASACGRSTATATLHRIIRHRSDLATHWTTWGHVTSTIHPARDIVSWHCVHVHPKRATLQPDAVGVSNWNWIWTMTIIRQRILISTSYRIVPYPGTKCARHIIA